MNTETLIALTILFFWLVVGFYGTLTLFRASFDVDIGDLFFCMVGSLAGPFMLFLGLIESGKFKFLKKVIFKKSE